MGEVPLTRNAIASGLTSPINALRAPLLRGMLRTLNCAILPELSSSAATDAAHSLIRTLALLVVDEEWNEAATSIFCRDFKIEETKAGLTAAQQREFAREQLVETAMTVADPTACLQVESYFQRQQAQRRDSVLAESARNAAPNATCSADEIASELNSYFQTRFIDNPPQITGIASLPGGRSKLTFRLLLSASPHLPEQCILRLDRPKALIATRAADEFELLQILWFAGVPVPQPLVVEKNSGALAGTFMLVSLIDGAKAGEYFPEVDGDVEGQSALGIDIAHILGKLHSLPLSALPAGNQVTPPDIETFRARIESIYADTIALGVRMAEFDIAYRWLLSNLHAALGPNCLQHGDVGLHNMIRRNDRIVALLDWELSAVGPAAADLAACRHLIKWLLPWQEFAAAYIDAGGPASALAEEHLMFHTVLRAFGATSVSQRCAHLFATGKTDDFVLANAGFDSAIRSRRLLMEAMCEVFKIPTSAE